MTFFSKTEPSRHSLDRQRLRVHKKRFWWLIGGLIACVACIVGLLWVLYYAAFFKVSSITIEGADRVTQEAVSRALFSSVPRSWFQGSLGPDHVLFWSLSDKHLDVRPIMAELSSVSFETGIAARAVRIKVVERQPFGIWCPSEDACVTFDREGIIFAPAPRTFGTLLLKIDGITGLMPVKGQPLFRDPAWLSRINETLDALQQSGLPAKTVSVHALALREWEAVTPSGVRLLFSFDFMPPQLSAVLSDFREKEKLDTLSYVDFRVPGRMYYK